MMRILITGASGFIGFHLVRELAGRGHAITGLDCISDQYDPELKYARLENLGIARTEIEENTIIRSRTLSGFEFVKSNLENRFFLYDLFASQHFDLVCHLAAQTGIRFSESHRDRCRISNVTCFDNVLDACRRYSVGRFIYTSSSSVYGSNGKTRFCETDPVLPISVYGLSKLRGESIAKAYSDRYGIETVGLRLFTVYGPWGRPDMAPFLFLKALLEKQPLQVNNRGRHIRDFTYIDDAIRAFNVVVSESGKTGPTDNPAHIFNVGSSNPVTLVDFIRLLEKCSGEKGVLSYRERQPGDMLSTWADTTLIRERYGWEAKVPLRDGIENFIAWYNGFYR